MMIYMAEYHKFPSLLNTLEGVFSKFTDREEAIKMARSSAEELRREGRIEGKAEGKAESRVEDICALLEIRFGVIPGSMREAIHAEKDVDRLKQLFAAAAQSASLGDFAKRM